MKEFKPDVPYQPISCELHSEYEFAIMHKKSLNLTWRKDEEVLTETNIIPVDVQTKNNAEYLVVKKSEDDNVFSIRLDYIIEMKTTIVKGSRPS